MDKIVFHLAEKQFLLGAISFFKKNIGFHISSIIVPTSIPLVSTNATVSPRHKRILPLLYSASGNRC